MRNSRLLSSGMLVDVAPPGHHPGLDGAGALLGRLPQRVDVRALGQDRGPGARQQHDSGSRATCPCPPRLLDSVSIHRSLLSVSVHPLSTRSPAGPPVRGRSRNGTAREIRPGGGGRSRRDRTRTAPERLAGRDGHSRRGGNGTAPVEFRRPRRPFAAVRRWAEGLWRGFDPGGRSSDRVTGRARSAAPSGPRPPPIRQAPATRLLPSDVLRERARPGFRPRPAGFGSSRCRHVMPWPPRPVRGRPGTRLTAHVREAYSELWRPR